MSFLFAGRRTRERGHPIVIKLGDRHAASYLSACKHMAIGDPSKIYDNIMEICIENSWMVTSIHKCVAYIKHIQKYLRARLNYIALILTFLISIPHDSNTV